MLPAARTASRPRELDRARRRRPRSRRCPTPAGASPLLDDRAGMPPGYVADAAEELALLDDALAQLVDAHRVDEPLHAGPQLVVAVAVVVERAQARLDRRQQVLAGGELLERLRRVRVGAEAAGDEHLEAGLDACRRRSGRLTRDHADVVEHRLAAVGGAAGEVDLELAGQALGVAGCAGSSSVVACGPRVMSSTSYGHAPARWQPATLRTVSPHASRVVRPTDASRRSTSGVCSSWTKWNWTFWRVVRWPQPREYVVGDVARASRAARASTRPYGTLTRTIWLWPPWRWP